MQPHVQRCGLIGECRTPGRSCNRISDAQLFVQNSCRSWCTGWRCFQGRIRSIGAAAAAIRMAVDGRARRPRRLPIRARKTCLGLRLSSKSATSTASQAYFTDLTELSMCGPLMSRRARAAGQPGARPTGGVIQRNRVGVWSKIKRSQPCGQKAGYDRAADVQGYLGTRTGVNQKACLRGPFTVRRLGYRSNGVRACPSADQRTLGNKLWHSAEFGPSVLTLF